jgi:hypothetical protein
MIAVYRKLCEERGQQPKPGISMPELHKLFEDVYDDDLPTEWTGQGVPADPLPGGAATT